jgi:hypothetical protein
MCISEEVSLTTLIIGSIVNFFIIYQLADKLYNKDSLVCFIFVLLWQYALLMQIPDAIAWNNIKNGKSTEAAGKLAAFLNLTQPLILLIGVLFITDNYYSLIPSFVVILAYIINIIMNIHKFEYDVKPGTDCNSLNYSWWNHVSSNLYLLSMTVIMLSIKNIHFKFFNLLIFYASLLISIFLNYSCNPGSFWCWSIASAGLLNFFVYNNFYN